jgi:hypothetical protein
MNIVTTSMPPNENDKDIEYWHYKSETGREWLYYSHKMDGNWQRFSKDNNE